MSQIKIGQDTIDQNDENLQAFLADAYQRKLRPVCLCKYPGIEMYIAKIESRYIVKRMPNSGGQHSADCESYEPPIELSGLGEVLGSAIQENPDEGTTAIKLDFSLSKAPGRAAPVASGVEKDSVKTDGKKLTLRGMLHYLWEEAGFNRWLPNMDGKRNWYQIRKHILNAAGDKIAKSTNLSEILYIPESFNPEKKDEIIARRMSKLAKLSIQDKGSRKLMIIIGEVKEIAPARYGFKIVFKHLPDYHFMLNEDLHKRLMKRFQVEIDSWSSNENAHMVCIGTFGVNTTGYALMEEMALMTVTENWIPFENAYDKYLIDIMTRQQRRFVKGLRYNLPSHRPLAALVASDTLPQPTAMYIEPPGASDDYLQTVKVLIAESSLSSWVWDSETEMPALPSAAEMTNKIQES